MSGVPEAHRALLELRDEAPDAEAVRAGLEALARARLVRDPVAVERALGTLARVLASLAAAADLAGRVAVRFHLAGPRPDRFSAHLAARTPPPVIPVGFREAVEDLRSRDPRGAEALELAGLEVAEVYGSVRTPRGGLVYPHGFALARGLDEEVARRIRDVIARGLEAGTPTERIARNVQRAGERMPESVRDWTLSYARTVVRTTVATAYSAGRFRETARLHRDLRGSGVEVGLEFRTAGDSDVRSGRAQDHGENHAALNGLRARVEDPIWLKFSPPGGYSCRCVCSPVVGEKLPRRASAPAGAAFAPGFGSRPDLATYGVTV